MNIIYSSSNAVSDIAIYQMKGADPDPVDRAGLVPSNKVYLNATETGEPWVNWGTDNKKPCRLSYKIGKSGVLNAAISAKARIAIGKGVAPVLVTGRDQKSGQEIMDWIYDPEIEDWLELNNDYLYSLQFIRDMVGYGWAHSRIRMDNGGQNIASFKTDDVLKCRLGEMNKETGEIMQTFYSPSWKDVKGPKDYKTLEMLSENNELADLQKRLGRGKGGKEFSLISRGDLNGKSYYPNPIWESVMEWVDLVIKVPEMKHAMFNNQMSIKYLITISIKYFERGDTKWNSYNADEKQQKFKDKVTEINKHLTGNDKAYKSIAAASYMDPSGKEIKDIQIEVLDDKVKDGKLLPESSAGDKQILFSLMMNPTIMGANTFGAGEGGAGSGSDIREAYLVQIMLMEAERRMNTKIFNIVKRFNGWSERYKGKNLQFRYPNLILTTLDTGGSTAPVNP